MTLKLGLFVCLGGKAVNWFAAKASSATHQKELLKVFVPFLQNRCYLINNFTPFNYVFVFDDLNIGRGDEMNI
jgi:hypothetical protein